MTRAARSDLRILALLTDGFGSSGGISRYNQDLVQALALSARVQDVVILPRFGSAPDHGEPKARDSTSKIHQLYASPARTAWSARALALVATGRFDVIFCGHLNAAPFAAGLAALRSVPLWLQVHGIDAWSERSWPYRSALRHAALITSVSRHTRARLIAWSDVDPARTRVLPNTFRALETATSTRNDISLRFGLSGKRVILTVGRLSAAERYKGHARIISALPEVLGACPDAVYLVVGSGDDLEALKQVAAGAGVSRHVIFAGHVPDHELPDIFRCADVFAMPSTGEGFGIVFLEAVAAGLPVIAGNRDGSVDALADGAIGTLIDPDDQPKLVQALVAGLEGTLVCNSEAAQRFSFNRFARHVDDLLSEPLLGLTASPQRGEGA